MSYPSTKYRFGYTLTLYTSLRLTYKGDARKRYAVANTSKKTKGMKYKRNKEMQEGRERKDEPNHDNPIY